MSYIINEAGEPIARTNVRVRTSCGWVSCSYRRTIDGDLVNKFPAKISNAKKWEAWEERNGTILPIAIITDSRELYIPGY